MTEEEIAKHKEHIEKEYPNVADDGTRYSNFKVLDTPAGYYLGRICVDTDDELTIILGRGKP